GSVAGRGGGVSPTLASDRQHRDELVHRHVGGAFRHHDLRQHAFIGGFHLHGGLVGLDLGDDVAGGDLVALLLQPFRQIALFHGGGQGRHEHVDRHGASAQGVGGAGIGGCIHFGFENAADTG